MFNRVTIVSAVQFFRRMSLTHNVITVTTVLPHHIYRLSAVLPWNFPRPRGNYRGYRSITAFPVTVSSSVTHKYNVHNPPTVRQISTQITPSNHHSFKKSFFRSQLSALVPVCSLRGSSGSVYSISIWNKYIRWYRTTLMEQSSK